MAGVTYTQARQELCLLKPGTFAIPWHAGRKQASSAQCLLNARVARRRNCARSALLMRVARRRNCTRVARRRNCTRVARWRTHILP